MLFKSDAKLIEWELICVGIVLVGNNWVGFNSGRNGLGGILFGWDLIQVGMDFGGNCAAVGTERFLYYNKTKNQITWNYFFRYESLILVFRQ